MKRLVLALVVATMGALLTAGMAAYHVHSLAHGAVEPGSTEVIVFEVPKGASLSKVGRDLAAEGLIPTLFTGPDDLWRIYIKAYGAPDVKAGRHEVTRGMNIPQLLEALASRPLSEDVKLTMVEGWRLEDADAWLAEHGWIEAGAYLKAASDPSSFEIPFPLKTPNLEGFLLPETYAVPKAKLDVPKLIQRQIDAFNARFVQPNAAAIEASKRSLHELVIIASMLEREEPKPINRPKVAEVMYKRLDAKTPLGIDATSRYTLDDWNSRRKFLAKLRDPDDPYNTRLRPGLPPTPIGAPSLISLKAALEPGPTTRNWYYLHDRQGNIHFARDAAGHEANRKRYNVY